MEAKEKYNIASILEELETMMVDFNFSDNRKVEDLREFMDSQVEKKKIDSFKTLVNGGKMTCIIEKDGYIFYAVQYEDYWKILYGKDGENYGGTQLQVYTQENVSKDGSFNFGEEGEETDVVFYEKIEGELNFDIVGTVNIYLYNDMNLTNSCLKRSAINIHEGSTLNLHLEEDDEGNPITLKVDSGFGSQGATGNNGQMKQNEGGDGGFAGIHVPVGATLNMYGNGTVIALGGDATPGGAGTSQREVEDVSGNGGGRRRSELVLELVGNRRKGRRI